MDAGVSSIGIVMLDFALGGTERIAARLATRWAEEGARVTIFCGSGEGPMRELLGTKVRVIEASPPIPRGPEAVKRLAQAAARHFAVDPVAAIFIPGNTHWPMAPALAALPKPQRPVVVAQVSAAMIKPQRSVLNQRLYRLRMRWLLRHADTVVTLSDAASAQAARILGRTPVETIPLPALGDDPVPPLPTSPEPPIILAVGRLVAEKGFDLLIDAFALIARRTDARLVILGEGPDRARLERLIERHALGERIHLPGYVADTRAWLDRARLCVLPSRFEGYPAVLVEAFAAGRPAIATACTPAAAELIDDPAIGRVVPVDDAPAMVEALRAMLATPPPDPSALARRVERHRIGPVARAYLALFARLVAAR